MSGSAARQLLALCRHHVLQPNRRSLNDGLRGAKQLRNQGRSSRLQHRRWLSTDVERESSTAETQHDWATPPEQDVWPYRSDFERALGNLTAGAAWPFNKDEFEEDELRGRLCSGFIAEEVASTEVNRNAAKLILSLGRVEVSRAEASSIMKDALAALQLYIDGIDIEPGEVKLVKFVGGCSQAVLASIVQGLQQPLPTMDLEETTKKGLNMQEQAESMQLISEAGLLELRRLAVKELLLRGRLERRTCMVLLMGLTHEREELVGGILDAAKEGLGYVKDRIGLVTSFEMAHAQHIAALEGLAAIQSSRVDTSVKAQALAADLLILLRSAPEIVRLLVQRDKIHLGLRALSALWHFPDCEDAFDPAWLAAIRGAARWSKELHPSTTEETIAFAACSMSRAGAWQALRCRFLLTQALRRNYNAVTFGGMPLSPDTGALWLMALAQAGEDIEALTRCDEPAKVSLLTSIKPLASPPDKDAGSWVGSTCGAARALWALSVLGKLEEPLSEDSTFGEALLARLAEDDQVFVLETCSLLAELREADSMTGDESSNHWLRIVQKLEEPRKQWLDGEAYPTFCRRHELKSRGGGEDD